METLNFKLKANFEKDGIYSVCLRGARRYAKCDDFDLYLYANGSESPELANIVSQKQFRFCDLNNNHCRDNYEVSARTVEGLKIAMDKVYDDFEVAEIVTILQFKVC